MREVNVLVLKRSCQEGGRAKPDTRAVRSSRRQHTGQKMRQEKDLTISEAIGVREYASSVVVISSGRTKAVTGPQADRAKQVRATGLSCDCKATTDRVGDCEDISAARTRLRFSAGSEPVAPLSPKTATRRRRRDSPAAPLASARGTGTTTAPRVCIRAPGTPVR